jgi:hypothetical protein
MQGLEFMAPVVIVLGFFTVIGWIVHVIVDGRRRRERLKVFTEFHSKLIDRLGSANEFGTFLESDGGKRFLATLSTERGGPRVGIMRSVHTGLIMLALSVGLLSLSALDLGSVEGRTFFLVCGVIVLSLAVGFLLSAAASLRLARTMGVMDDNRLDVPATTAR